MYNIHPTSVVLIKQSEGSIVSLGTGGPYAELEFNKNEIVPKIDSDCFHGGHLEFYICVRLVESLDIPWTGAVVKFQNFSEHPIAHHK